MGLSFKKARNPFIAALSDEAKVNLIDLIIGEIDDPCEETRSIRSVITSAAAIKSQTLSNNGKLGSKKRRGSDPKPKAPKITKQLTTEVIETPAEEVSLSEGTVLDTSVNTVSTVNEQNNAMGNIVVDVDLESLSFEEIANMAIFELTKNKVTVNEQFVPKLKIDEDVLDKACEDWGNDDIAKIVLAINPYFFEYPELYIYDFSDGWEFKPKYNSKKEGVMEFMKARQDNITTEVRELLTEVVYQQEQKDGFDIE